MRSIFLISSNVTPSLLNNPPCTMKNRFSPCGDKIGACCPLTVSGALVALTRVARGTEKIIHSTRLLRWSLSKLYLNELTGGENVGEELRKVSKKSNQYRKFVTLYDCSPCLCLASPSNPYVRFMSFASWLPRLMYIYLG